MSGTDFSRCMVLCRSSLVCAFCLAMFDLFQFLCFALCLAFFASDKLSFCLLYSFAFLFLSFSPYYASFFSSFFNLSRYFLLLSLLVNMATNKIKIADWTQCPRWPTGYSAPTMQQFTAHAQCFLLVQGGQSGLQKQVLLS